MTENAGFSRAKAGSFMNEEGVGSRSIDRYAGLFFSSFKCLSCPR